jgi:hypothetical protein
MKFPNSSIVVNATDAIKYCLIAQGKGSEVKEYQSIINQEIKTVQQDSAKTIIKITQRSIPECDIPEYVISGIASIDLPGIEKKSSDMDSFIQPEIGKPFRETQRDRETLELEIKGRPNDSQIGSEKYSGLVQTGIGTYFSPQAKLMFVRTLSDFHYTLDGEYHLSKGYAVFTDRSGGSITATARTFLPANIPVLQNSVIDGTLGYQKESFYFYGSSSPDLKRIISDIGLDVRVQNQNGE